MLSYNQRSSGNFQGDYDEVHDFYLLIYNAELMRKNNDLYIYS
jgi:hypothetical protein